MLYFANFVTFELTQISNDLVDDIVNGIVLIKMTRRI